MIGVLKKRVEVASNDPLHPTVTLTVKATVRPEIELSDTGIFFGSAPRGTEVRRTVLITLPEGKSIRILGAETRDARVSVRLEAVAGSGDRKWRLIAVQRADAAPGTHFGEIVVRTTSRLTPRLSISERGTIEAPGR